MKKIFSILAVTLFLGCSPEETETKENCNCGIITTRQQLSDQIGNYMYQYKNNCTDKVEFFVTWDIYNVGDEYCEE